MAVARLGRFPVSCRRLGHSRRAGSRCRFFPPRRQRRNSLALRFAPWRDRQRGGRAGRHQAIAGHRGAAHPPAAGSRHESAAANGGRAVQIATTPAAVTAMLPHLLADKPPKNHQFWCPMGLANFLDCAPPELAEPVRRKFQEFLLSFDQNRLRNQDLARYLAKVADPAAKDALEDIYANARDTTSVLYALEGLSRLEPDRAIERTLAFHRKVSGAFKTSLRVLCDYARIAMPMRSWPGLPPEAATGHRSALDRRVRPLTIGWVGGQEYLAALRALLEPDARMWLTWRREGLTLDAALADFHAAGVLPLSPDEILAKMQELQYRETEPRQVDLTDPKLLKIRLELGRHPHLLRRRDGRAALQPPAPGAQFRPDHLRQAGR